MPDDPQPTPEGQPVPGRRFFARKWQGKDIALFVMGLLLVAVSGYAFREPLAAAMAKLKAGAKGGQTVRVFDVQLDRENRQYVDILFDKPLGTGHVDEILDPPPATVEPALGGAWKWKDTNALRFQPSGGFPVASEYKIALIPERLLQEGQVFSGDTEVTVRTDQFLVESVDLTEEPALAGKAKVFFRGEIHFNYPVNPEVLAPKIHLVDPSLSQPVKVTLETTWEEQAITFRTDAVQKQKDERKLRLVIAADLTPASGNVPLGEEYGQEIPLGSSTTLAVWGFEAQPGVRESTIKVRFSSPISAGVAEPYVKLAPAVPVHLSAERNELMISGELKPGTTYKLTVAKGMPATDDAVLREDYEADVAIPDLEAAVDFQSQGMFLAASGNHTVAIQNVNAPKAHLTIDRIYRNNLFFLFQYGGFFNEQGYFGEVEHALGDRLKEVTLNLGGRKNEPKVTPLTLDRYVDTKEPGLYRVSIGKPDDYEAEQRWLLLTDLGLVAKRGPGEILVWVSSVRDLAAVEGAQVTLVSDQNQVMGQGRTDGSGVWHLRDAKTLAKGHPYLLTVEKGDDFTFLLLDTMAVDTAGLDVGGAEAPGEGYQAFLYGERDLYRPGEQLKGLAVVRDGSLHAPPPMPVLLRHRDPQGRELETRRLAVDARGLAAFQLDLPAYSLTGHHTLETVVAEKVIGQYRFQVEEFVPDRIAVEIQTGAGAKIGPGQELAYTVQGSYLFGPPAAGLPVESRVRLVDTSFTAKGYEAFSFRNDMRKLDDREVLSAQGKLDDQGRSPFQVTMPAGAPVPSSLEAVVTARVQEQGGRGVSALSRLRVDPYPYYVGLRRPAEGAAKPGEEVGLEYVTLSPEGKEVPSGALRADLYQQRWNTVLRRLPNGGWRYESTQDPVLVTSRTVAAGKSRGTFGLTPRQYGSYLVVLTDPATQASASVELFAEGWGVSPWAIKNPSRLELALDKEEYAPGDTARVQVRAPFSGKLMVTVERDRVFETKVYPMAGNTATIEVPVTTEYRPNAYITATLIRPVGDLEPGSAGRAFGAVPLPVNRVANRLKPEIAAPPEIRPNTKLEIAVKTAPGAVVTVAAVDEGILQLAAQKTPDPFEFFYRRLALGVTSYDTFSLLLPEVKPAPAGGGEGAQGQSQYVRTEGIRRVEPVAFWSGPVTADGGGNARVAFQVPEFQGALRIMAVALDDDRFGSAEQRTRVRTPLVLLPTLPRILSFGETLKVPITVRNDTGRAGTFQVGLAAQGPVKVETAAQPATLENGRETTVYFTVTTGDAAGDARFVATAQGNGETTRSTTGVAVRPDLPPVTREQAGSTKATIDLPLQDAGSFRPETLTRELRIGPLPLVQFSAKLDHLLQYPYGCLEQTLSVSFPLIYLGDLAKMLEPEVLDPKKGHGDPADMVQSGLRRIATMQLPSGGFSLWPGGNEIYPWGSLYAAHFLVEARRAGHPVDDGLYEGALRWVAGQVKAKSAYGTEELQRAAYGLWVLARAGRPDLGTMDYLRQKQTAKMRPESRSMLAAAYAAAGNPRAVENLLAGLGEVEEGERQTGGNLNSPVRNRALVLLALLDAAPASPRIPALVDRLARDAGTLPWWNTQEEGFTFLALGQLAHRQANQPPYSGAVFAGNRKIGTFSSKAAVRFPDLRGTEPLRLQMDAGSGGAAFYSVLTRGVPTDSAFKPETAGLEIERAFLARDGKPLDLNSVQQGDLVVIKTRVRSTAGAVENVVIVNLLPSGLEVENPRLQTTEQMPWITDANLQTSYLDLRDDRILLFTDLPANTWQTFYTLVRAVAPGSFRLPPVQAEAMYNPALRVTGERGTMEVKLR
jgi:uncharacterized protein YfaS (alpha-2-macroglobulin family)